MRLLIAATVAAVVSAGASGDVGRADDRAALAAALPRVDFAGGPFLRRPQLLTITFAGDDPAVVSELESFAFAIGASSWWSDVFAERCAAPGDCVRSPVEPRAIRAATRFPPQVHAVDVEAWLAAAAARGSLGPLTADALALIYLPAGTALTDALSGRYCAGGPRAYHRALTVGTGRLAFAVIPRCGDLDATTMTASHEIVEAVTNPDPARPGFRMAASPIFVGFRAAGAEPADSCGSAFRAGGTTRLSGGWAVHPAWSNEAAATGTDPCVPAANRPYVAFVPREPRVRLTTDGHADVWLDARADRAASAWVVAAVELTPVRASPALSLSLDRTMVGPGAVGRLTIRAHGPFDAPRVVALVSTHDGVRSAWPLLVVPPP
jgi:hypothetical protein